MGTHEPDIRECFVWLEYTSGRKVQLIAWLDIDDCIEQQIRMSFESPPGTETGPKLADFKWDLVERERYQTIHNEYYS